MTTCLQSITLQPPTNISAAQEPLISSPKVLSAPSNFRTAYQIRTTTNPSASQTSTAFPSIRRASPDSITKLPESEGPARRLVVFRTPKKQKCTNTLEAALSRLNLKLKEFFTEKMDSMFFWLIEAAHRTVSFIVYFLTLVFMTTRKQTLGLLNKLLKVQDDKNTLSFPWFARSTYSEKTLEQKRKQSRHESFKQEKKPLTLVLDLDETLIHSSVTMPTKGTFETVVIFKSNGDYKEVYLKKRPYLQEFLLKMSKEYNIVLFTAAKMEYANAVIDLIDPNLLITKRLYRDSCLKAAKGWAKDLVKVEPDLHRVILLDNCKVAGSLQPENHFPIKSWFHDDSDRSLLESMIALTNFAKQWNADTSSHKDIRDRLEEFLTQKKSM